MHYFVSYYDYYQPEAYIPQRDIYIEKDASINEEIDGFGLQQRVLWFPSRCRYRRQGFLYLWIGVS